MEQIGKELIGRKIVAVRQMTKTEVEFEGWFRGTTIYELDDGTLIYPSQDDEGNDSGALFGRKGKTAQRFGFQSEGV